jgi:hypothetical protein
MLYLFQIRYTHDKSDFQIFLSFSYLGLGEYLCILYLKKLSWLEL